MVKPSDTYVGGTFPCFSLPWPCNKDYRHEPAICSNRAKSGYHENGLPIIVVTVPSTSKFSSAPGPPSPGAP